MQLAIELPVFLEVVAFKMYRSGPYIASSTYQLIPQVAKRSIKYF
jgi:hypothetical protein